MAITVGGTSITFNDSTTQSTAGLTSAVTSVATGNGLSGGTITSTGTLSVACPSFNTVGSYVFAVYYGGAITAGSTYSAGSSLKSTGMNSGYFPCLGYTWTVPSAVNNLSGTWRAMGIADNGGAGCATLFCRVS